VDLSCQFSVFNFQGVFVFVFLNKKYPLWGVVANNFQLSIFNFLTDYRIFCQKQKEGVSDIQNKFTYFVLLSTCTTFIQKMKVGGVSAIQIKTGFYFVLLSTCTTFVANLLQFIRFRLCATLIQQASATVKIII